jgi:hypothetical protein
MELIPLKIAKETKWHPIYHTFSKKTTLFGQEQLDFVENIEEAA